MRKEESIKLISFFSAVVADFVEDFVGDVLGRDGYKRLGAVDAWYHHEHVMEKSSVCCA